MPKRAAPGRRLAIEEAVPEEIFLAFQWLLLRIGARPEGWQGVAPVAALLSTLAVCLKADELQETESYSKSAAFSEAAARLGVNPDTIDRRMERWWYDSEHNAP